MPKYKKEAAADAEKQNQRFYGSMLIMLIAPAVMAYYFYGLKVFVLITASILTAVVCEGLGDLIMRRKKTGLYDLNAIFTGAVIALMLPASDSVLLPVIGSAFAIIVAKLPFGGTKSAPFVPAAAGFAFLCVCWPTDVFDYTVVSAQFGAVASEVPGTSIASMLQAGNSLRLNLVSIFDILSGNFPGPMGAGSILVMLAASIHMLFTRPSVLLNTLGYILSCAVIALVFPRGHNFIDLDFPERLSSMVLELCSGTLIFTALFLLPDLATSPKSNNFHRLYYGIFSGVLCMLMRYFGAFEEGACFALLLSNALWPFIENRLNKYKQPAVNEFNKRNTSKASVNKNGGYADGE